MRRALRTWIVSAAIGVSVFVTFASTNPAIRPVFFGDGFDHTTCADAPMDRACQ